MVDAGATTIWERSDGWTSERGFQAARMNSLNHYALGSVGEWLRRFVLGLDQPPGEAGFGRLVVRPHPGAGPTAVAGFPGAPGAREAVFEVGSGSHQFAGPDVAPG